jgi:phosphate-selective porin OprO/OprP
MRSFAFASCALASMFLSTSQLSAQAIYGQGSAMHDAVPTATSSAYSIDDSQPTDFAAPQEPSLEERVRALEQQAIVAPKPSPLPLNYPNIKINGVFQADAVLFGQDAASRAAYGDIQDGADFRRARLAASGNVSEQISYFMQMDFAFFGRPTFTDLWITANDVPVFGNIRVGQWKQPFSLEVVSSFRYTTFMERSVIFQPFTPFRHLGIGFYDWSEDLNTTWAASLIRTGQDQFGGSISDDGGNGVVGRLTHLLHWDEASEGRGYLHVGGAYYLNSPPNDTVRFRSIPEMFVGEQPGANPPGTSGQAVPGQLNGTPFFVDTNNLNVETVNTFGAELLWVQGPLSLQTEAVVAVVDRSGNQETLSLPGGYLQVGYFLTGEHRPYDRKAGAIDRVKPFENFFWVRTCDGHGEYGMGAWEVAGRVSYIDLNDANVRGGEMTDLTLGINWYLNPYTKLVANYIHSFTEHPTFGDTETDIYAMRAQIDF